MAHIENNNNESYISSVGDSADSFSNIPAGTSSPKIEMVNSARKSGRSEDRRGGAACLFSPLIEPSVFPTLDHELKGAYQLVADKTLQMPTAGEGELAQS